MVRVWPNELFQRTWPPSNVDFLLPCLREKPVGTERDTKPGFLRPKPDALPLHQTGLTATVGKPINRLLLEIDTYHICDSCVGMALMCAIHRPNH